jgi:nucleotide-binding universal stress UspA family protein
MSTTAPRIVVGIDGSTCSVEALQWALRIANTTGATIDAVIAWNLPNMYDGGYLPGDYDPARDAEKIVTDAVDAVVGVPRPIGMRLVVKQGTPAKVLRDESEGAQMLIVGSRGHGGFLGLLLGSVSATCVEHTQCPVLVVHGERDGSGERND